MSCCCDATPRWVSPCGRCSTAPAGSPSSGTSTPGRSCPPTASTSSSSTFPTPAAGRPSTWSGRGSTAAWSWSSTPPTTPPRSHHACSVVQRPFEIVELWQLVTTDPDASSPGKGRDPASGERDVPPGQARRPRPPVTRRHPRLTRMLAQRRWMPRPGDGGASVTARRPPSRPSRPATTRAPVASTMPPAPSPSRAPATRPGHGARSRAGRPVPGQRPPRVGRLASPARVPARPAGRPARRRRRPRPAEPTLPGPARPSPSRSAPHDPATPSGPDQRGSGHGQRGAGGRHAVDPAVGLACGCRGRGCCRGGRRRACAGSVLGTLGPRACRGRDRPGQARPTAGGVPDRGTRPEPAGSGGALGRRLRLRAVVALPPARRPSRRPHARGRGARGDAHRHPIGLGPGVRTVPARERPATPQRPAGLARPGGPVPPSNPVPPGGAGPSGGPVRCGAGGGSFAALDPAGVSSRDSFRAPPGPSRAEPTASPPPTSSTPPAPPPAPAPPADAPAPAPSSGPSAPERDAGPRPPHRRGRGGVVVSGRRGRSDRPGQGRGPPNRRPAQLPTHHRTGGPARSVARSGGRGEPPAASLATSRTGRRPALEARSRGTPVHAAQTGRTHRAPRGPARRSGATHPRGRRPGRRSSGLAGGAGARGARPRRGDRARCGGGRPRRPS